MEPKLKKGNHAKKRNVAESLENPTESSKSTTKSIPPKSTEGLTPKSDAADILSTKEAPEPPPSKKRKASVPDIEVDITASEPPSKKVLRRLKKGRSLPNSKSGADSSSKPSQSISAKKPEAEKRSEHGIWIGNLPWSCTKSDLRTFLVANSDIADEAITRIHMPGPDDRKPVGKADDSKPWKKQHNKGFAYVDFTAPEDVAKAVELSELLLSGRRVLIKDSKSFEGRPQKTKEESRNDSRPPTKRVFLGNLRFDTTEESLEEHFSCCGEIAHVMVATFEDSGKCKGYAWITFEELEAAQAAVRGYVLVKEEEDEDALDPDSEDAISNNEEKIALMKKWFVDKIHRRPVRREFAEDAQVRYKKRFGKDGVNAKSDPEAAADTTDTGGKVDTITEKPPPVKK